MSYRHCLLLVVLLTSVLASACDFLEQACPEGFWRPRANEACVPIPDVAADSGTRDGGGGGTDAGPGTDAGNPTDAGSSDASTPMDAGSAPDAATDAGSATDGAAADAGP